MGILKMKNIVNVISHYNFNELCENNGWTDVNVETLTDKAFISIVGTEEVVKALDIDMTEHWFKQNHPNVLNLNFDDVTRDFVYKGAHCKALTEDQAKEIVEFIENNIGKEFYIHCLAAISRSAACGKFIADNYDYTLKAYDYIRPNGDVIAKLNRVLWERKFNS